MVNQKFEIIVDENLYECEKIVRSKIKDYNEKGYTCISHSMIQRQRDNSWIISLLFEPTRAVLGV